MQWSFNLEMTLICFEMTLILNEILHVVISIVFAVIILCPLFLNLSFLFCSPKADKTRLRLTFMYYLKCKF